VQEPASSREHLACSFLAPFAPGSAGASRLDGLIFSRAPRRDRPAVQDPWRRPRTKSAATADSCLAGSTPGSAAVQESRVVPRTSWVSFAWPSLRDRLASAASTGSFSRRLHAGIDPRCRIRRGARERSQPLQRAHVSRALRWDRRQCRSLATSRDHLACSLPVAFAPGSAGVRRLNGLIFLAAPLRRDARERDQSLQRAHVPRAPRRDRRQCRSLASPTSIQRAPLVALASGSADVSRLDGIISRGLHAGIVTVQGWG